MTLSDANQPELTLPRAPTNGPAPQIEIAFAGLTVVLDASGALLVPSHSTLIVADLHLEKGSNAAARGRPLPPLDTHDTLRRLVALIAALTPARVICLGDSFHDGKAGARMNGQDAAMLADLCASVGEWVWIAGNHDPEAPQSLPGTRTDALAISGVVLSHAPCGGNAIELTRLAPLDGLVKPGHDNKTRPIEPAASTTPAQIVGHFHPKARVSRGGYVFHGRCFAISDQFLMLPAFGAYAGGLRCDHPDLLAWHSSPVRTFFLHRDKVWPLG